MNKMHLSSSFFCLREAPVSLTLAGFLAFDPVSVSRDLWPLAWWSNPLAVERKLLAVRNGKMGAFIAHFDIPPVKSCPGRSSICEHYCYCRHGRFMTRAVKRRLEWCYRQALKSDFTSRLIEEIRDRGVLVLRWHVAGDVFSPSYARAILEVMRACDKVRFYLYSRSYRIPTILPLLAEMAALDNCQVWFSCDQETGEPDAVPAGVKLCYMQHAPDAVPQRSELVFRTRNMRKQPVLSLPLVCPQEVDKSTTCGSCQYCFK